MIPARRPRRTGPRRLQTDLRLVTELPLELRHRVPTYEAATILEATAAAVPAAGLTAACSVMGVAPPRQPRCGTCIYCHVQAATAGLYPDGVDPDAVVIAHQAAEERDLHTGSHARTRTDTVAALVAAAYDLFHVTLPPDVQIARTP